MKRISWKVSLVYPAKEMKSLFADYVMPVSNKPLRDAGIVIDGDSIIAVGSRDEIVQKFPAAETEDFGQAAIVPGFVNCHSHLELTALRGALCDVEGDFMAWLLRVNQLRSEAGRDELMRWAIAGAKEAAAAGITTLGDVGRFGDIGLSALRESRLRGIVFQETDFSPDNLTAEADFRSLAEKVENLYRSGTERITFGISPHSPFTVSSKLFELIAEYSIINRIPIAIHTAESAAENELMTAGGGFFLEIYKKMGFSWESPRTSSVDYLEKLGVLAGRPLLIHCVNVSKADIARIRNYGASIAHCPKSNAKLGHGVAPLAAFLDSGISVGLGSDSVASNNVCDLIEEARFAILSARTRSEDRRMISAEAALELATLGGARALGLDSQIGSLEAGKKADLTVVSLTGPSTQPINDPASALIFAASGRDVVRTLVSGEIVFQRRLAENIGS
ncbi:MAG: hypothetical protein C4324_04535 [Blastocatellia bacterium]